MERVAFMRVRRNQKKGARIGRPNESTAFEPAKRGRPRKLPQRRSARNKRERELTTNDDRVDLWPQRKGGGREKKRRTTSSSRHSSFFWRNGLVRMNGPQSIIGLTSSNNNNASLCQEKAQRRGAHKVTTTSPSIGLTALARGRHCWSIKNRQYHRRFADRRHANIRPPSSSPPIFHSLGGIGHSPQSSPAGWLHHRRRRP
jgi:hypothetical protein